MVDMPPSGLLETKSACLIYDHSTPNSIPFRIQRNVAVKIGISSLSSNTRELDILQVLSAQSSKKIGSEHIVQLLDNFWLEGPNGIHNCLILEITGPSIPTLLEAERAGDRLPGKVAKRVAKEVALGLNFLHQNGIGHGGQSIYQHFLLRNAANYCLKISTQVTSPSHPLSWP